MFGSTPFGGAAFGDTGPSTRLLVVEATDIVEISGGISVSGDLAVTETTFDTVSIEGVVKIFGDFAVTETADTFDASGVVSTVGTLSVVEGNDFFRRIFAGVGIQDTRSYVPGIVPAGLPEEVQTLVQYLNDELATIATFINEPRDEVSFEVMRFPPKKPVRGMVVYADGVDWNPGSGEGLYRFTSAGWIFMG